jgi:hypothetical protein
MKITKKILNKLIAEAVSARIQSTVDNKNKELKDKFKEKVVKEQSYLRPEDIERLDGLVNEHDLVELERAIYSIIEAFEPEGFGVAETVEYIAHHVEDVARRYTSLQERELSKKEKTGLKKIHKEVPKKDFYKKYGKEEGEKIYYGTTTKMAKKKY